MNLLALDSRLTFWLYRGDQFSLGVERFLYVLASSVVYLVPLILLVLFFRAGIDRLKSIKIFLATVTAWFVFNKPLGSFLYSQYHFRDRPFADLGLQELLFEQPQKAFPSDHSAVIMAVGLCLLYYKYPKLGAAFLTLGVISSLARVAIGFHYVGDIVGGWLLGAVAFGLVVWLDRPITNLYRRFVPERS